MLDNLIKDCEIHIAKSSSGWKFCFDANEKTFNSIDKYKKYLEDYEIVSEYGEEYTHQKFWEHVETKQNLKNGTINYPTCYFILDGYEFSTSTNFC